MKRFLFFINNWSTNQSIILEWETNLSILCWWQPKLTWTLNGIVDDMSFFYEFSISVSVHHYKREGEIMPQYRFEFELQFWGYVSLTKSYSFCIHRRVVALSRRDDLPVAKPLICCSLICSKEANFFKLSSSAGIDLVSESARPEPKKFWDKSLEFDLNR